jgi:hypothetical protein
MIIVPKEKSLTSDVQSPHEFKKAHPKSGQTNKVKTATSDSVIYHDCFRLFSQKTQHNTRHLTSQLTNPRTKSTKARVAAFGKNEQEEASLA